MITTGYLLTKSLIGDYIFWFYKAFQSKSMKNECYFTSFQPLVPNLYSGLNFNNPLIKFLSYSLKLAPFQFLLASESRQAFLNLCLLTKSVAKGG